MFQTLVSLPDTHCLLFVRMHWQVTQGSASETDLLALAEGCLLTAAHHAAAADMRSMSDESVPDVALAPPSRQRLRGLCRAFQAIQADGKFWAPHPPRDNGAAGLFHQRDFVYL